jgi:hypothetical protein
VAGQKGNTINASVPAVDSPPASGMVIDNDATQASVAVPAPAPVRQINGATLRNLGARYKALYDRYASERIPAEQRWLKNLRQYLGIYDPVIALAAHEPDVPG